MMERLVNEEVCLNMFWQLLFLQLSSEELHGIVCDVSFQLLLDRFGPSVLTRRLCCLLSNSFLKTVFLVSDNMYLPPDKGGGIQTTPHDTSEEGCRETAADTSQTHIKLLVFM